MKIELSLPRRREINSEAIPHRRGAYSSIACGEKTSPSIKSRLPKTFMRGGDYLPYGLLRSSIRLEQILAQGIEAGHYCCAVAFGAGLSIHGMLLAG